MEAWCCKGRWHGWRRHRAATNAVAVELGKVGARQIVLERATGATGTRVGTGIGGHRADQREQEDQDHLAAAECQRNVALDNGLLHALVKVDAVCDQVAELGLVATRVGV